MLPIIERLLAEGHIYTSRSHWKVRRNGETKTWKTRPADYRIPVKAGLRSTGQLEPKTLQDFAIRLTPESRDFAKDTWLNLAKAIPLIEDGTLGYSPDTNGYVR
jgi:hypothetical protein